MLFKAGPSTKSARRQSRNPVKIHDQAAWKGGVRQGGPSTTHNQAAWKAGVRQGGPRCP